MRTLATIAASCMILSAVHSAPAQSGQPDLSALPEVIKNLKWKTIDPATLSAAERCRVLAFMNDALDEISAQARAEADLMSAFIDQKNLGPDFAISPQPADASALTYDDGVKVAAAMLRGPLAQASYVTDYPDNSDPTFLTATIGLFDSSSKRKWGECVEGRMQVRWMAKFLHDTNQASAYQSWVPTEVQRREQEYQAKMDQQRAEAAAKRQAKQQSAAELQKQREQEAQDAKAQQEALAASQQMQQAMGAAQQNQEASVVPNQDDDNLYPAYGYGAAAYLGTSAWYRDGAYRGAAGANVNHRMSGWNRAARRR